jgi:hypothetical protein
MPMNKKKRSSTFHCLKIPIVLAEFLQNAIDFLPVFGWFFVFQINWNHAGTSMLASTLASVGFAVSGGFHGLALLLQILGSRPETSVSW